MNEFLEMIKSRRSIRKYLDRPIDKEILKKIVDTGRLAPSAKNIQPWEFILVVEKKTLKKISDFVTWGPFIKDSAACVIICGNKNAKRFVEDCCLAAENIMLSAKSFGIGSCYVAALGKNLDGVRELLNIPENYEIVCFIPLGYFEKNPEPYGKRDLKSIIHWEKFQINKHLKNKHY